MKVDWITAEDELLLGLAGDARREIPNQERCLDVNAWLLDCVAFRIACLGHQDRFPQPRDWENLLRMLEPGEELLYVLDYSAEGDVQGQAFSLWIALRLGQNRVVDRPLLQRRKRRAQALVAQFRRQAFPGSDVSWIRPADIASLLSISTASQPRCVCVSGIPSAVGQAKEHPDIGHTGLGPIGNLRSLNDVAESVVDVGCDFQIAFVVRRENDEELRRTLDDYTKLRDLIHPLVKMSMQRSQSHVESRSESEGTSENTEQSKMSGSNVGVGVSASASVQAGVNFGVGSGSASVSGTVSGQASWSTNRTTSRGRGRSWNLSRGTSNSREEGVNQEFVQSEFELAENSLKRKIEALHEARGSGAFRWAACVFADQDAADLIAGTIEGVVGGSGSKDHPLTRFEITGTGVTALFKSTLSIIDAVQLATPVLPLSQVCHALLLPEAELPGIRLRRNVFYGRASSPSDVSATKGRTSLRSGMAVNLGPDAFYAIDNPESAPQVQIPFDELFRHVLVAGTTGAGKTTRVVEILNEIERKDLSIVVFETAKRTYRNRLKRKGAQGTRVYALGGTEGFAGRAIPFRINPFYFELGTSLRRHIAVLSDALSELMPSEAMIGPYLRQAVEAAYTERGWDIARGVPIGGDGEPAVWPTVVDFVAHVREVAGSLRYGPEVSANYLGALEGRASLFFDATFEDIFSHRGNVPIDRLFPPGHDAIIEVDHLPPSEVDIRAFVITLLLARLRSVQSTRVDAVRRFDAMEQADMAEAPRDWIFVIEEAHNILERGFEERRPQTESNAGRTLVRSVDRLLQEGRELGIGLFVVDQSPCRLARSVISNTNTKIIMRLEDGAEMAEMGRAIGLEEEDWRKLGYLQVGEAIVKASYMDAPIKMAPSTLSDVPDSNHVDPDMSRNEDDSASHCVVDVLSNVVEIERWWKELLEDWHVVRDWPDWEERFFTSVGDQWELAAFLAAKLVVSAPDWQPYGVVGSRRVRDLLARTTGRGEVQQIVEAIRAHVDRRFKEILVDALRDLERMLFRIAAGALGPPPRNLFGRGQWGISPAALLLERAGAGSATGWRQHLRKALTSSAPTWQSTTTALTRYARRERSDLLSCVAILGLCRATLADSPLVSASAGSEELLYEVHRFVEEVSSGHEDDQAYNAATSRGDVEVELTRRICRVIGARDGATSDELRELRRSLSEFGV